MFKEKEENIEEDNSALFNRAKIFFDRKIEVHVSAKRNGFRFFYNGSIKELTPDFLILEEKRIGEVPVQFNEIFDIEKFVDKEDETSI